MYFIKKVLSLFQLHHTGIKTIWFVREFLGISVFQLHHTGIKTYFISFTVFEKSIFQLHHTGIKTHSTKYAGFIELYFNCTIQELKLNESKSIAFARSQFQLHHTGIKTITHIKRPPNSFRFQLHHTGIKTGHNSLGELGELYFNCTIQELKQSLYPVSRIALQISIAPYRN